MASQFTASIQQLYLAYLGRPADRVSLARWERNISSSEDLTALAKELAMAPEYQSQSQAGSAQLVYAIYVNLFGRAPDLGGLLYWATLADSGAVSQATLGLAIASAGASANNGDSVVLEYKVSVATAFTNSLQTAEQLLAYDNPAGQAVGHDFLQSVTGALSVVDAASSIALAVTNLTAQAKANTPVDPAAAAVQAATLDEQSYTSKLAAAAKAQLAAADALSALAKAQQAEQQASQSAALSDAVALAAQAATDDAASKDGATALITATSKLAQAKLDLAAALDGGNVETYLLAKGSLIIAESALAKAQLAAPALASAALSSAAAARAASADDKAADEASTASAAKLSLAATAAAQALDAAQAALDAAQAMLASSAVTANLLDDMRAAQALQDASAALTLAQSTKAVSDALLKAQADAAAEVAAQATVKTAAAAASSAASAAADSATAANKEAGTYATALAAANNLTLAQALPGLADGSTSSAAAALKAAQSALASANAYAKAAAATQSDADDALAAAAVKSATLAQSSAEQITARAATDSAGAKAEAAKYAAKTLPLTTEIDKLQGGLGDDRFVFSGNGPSSGLSAFDLLDGDAGNDSLEFKLASAIDTTLTSYTIKNIESASFTSLASIKVDSTSWSGLLNLTVSSQGGASLTAAASTKLTVQESSLGAGALLVNGGGQLALTVAKAGSGAVTIGAVTAPTGAISLNHTASEAGLIGAITVNGGSTVALTMVAGNAVNTTMTNAAIDVRGGAATTSVSVLNPATATADAETAGVTANTVSITDNGSSLSTATVKNFTSLSYSGSALSSLSLQNGSANISIANTASTGAAKTLALSLDSQSGGTLSDNGIYTSLNLSLSGGSSTLANINASAVRSLNVDGDQSLTLTSAAGMSALSSVKLSGSAGLTANLSAASLSSIDLSASSASMSVTIDPSRATYLGSSGSDTLSLTAVAVGKAIDLGDGDDSVSLAGFMPTASVAGGAGTDSLTIGADLAETASGANTFAGRVSGFEKLLLTGGAAQTIDARVLGNYAKLSVGGGNGMNINNLPADATLTLSDAGTLYFVNNSGLAGSSDALTVVLDAAASTNFASIGFTADDYEILSIQSSAAAVFTVLGSKQSTINVGGSGGLSLTIDNTDLSSLDASSASGDFSFTAPAMSKVFTLKGGSGANTIDFSNATKLVTYTGGSGVDTITVTNGLNNVIDLGDSSSNNKATISDGDNSLTSSATGTDDVTVGNGNNTISLGDGLNKVVAGSGNNRYTGGADVDNLAFGVANGDLGANTITVGAGDDVVQLHGSTLNGFQYSTITDARAGLKIILDVDNGTAAFDAAKVQLNETAVFRNFLDAAVAGDGSVNGRLAWFQFKGDTYIVTDNSASNLFQTGVDSVVKLTGLVTINGFSGAAGSGSFLLA